MTAGQLRNQIEQAFPATPFYGPITSCDCEECADIQKELWHKQWDESSTVFLEFTCSPTLLTPEAFHAFLPAYLLRALDDLSQHSVVVEFTVYSLCPGESQENEEAHAGREEGTSRLWQRARLMTPAQIQAIRAFLVFVQQNAGDGEWFRPFVAGTGQCLAMMASSICCESPIKASERHYFAY